MCSATAPVSAVLLQNEDHVDVSPCMLQSQILSVTVQLIKSASPVHSDDVRHWVDKNLAITNLPSERCACNRLNDLVHLGPARLESDIIPR